MSALAPWIEALGAAALEADRAETRFRSEIASRLAALSEERAVAYRRANLARALAEAVAGKDDEATAVAHGLAALRTRLGWASDSDARSEILDRFAPVCAAMWALDASEGEGDPPAPAAALAAFEAWYLAARGTAFWRLFENVMPETPLVDW